MRRLLNARPRGGARLLLGFLPIAALILLYLVAAQARHAENPRDKILPTPAAMAQSIEVMAFTVDPRTGEIPLVADTKASLTRLGIAIGAAALTTLGRAWGPWWRRYRLSHPSPCCRSCSLSSASARPPRSC